MKNPSDAAALTVDIHVDCFQLCQHRRKQRCCPDFTSITVSEDLAIFVKSPISTALRTLTARTRWWWVCVCMMCACAVHLGIVRGHHVSSLIGSLTFDFVLIPIFDCDCRCGCACACACACVWVCVGGWVGGWVCVALRGRREVVCVCVCVCVRVCV
jgi:hypothetical protein